MKQKFREMHDHMQQQQQKNEPPPVNTTSPKPAAEDYIDFEEVK
jgi:hypothetical protein